MDVDVLKRLYAEGQTGNQLATDAFNEISKLCERIAELEAQLKEIRTPWRPVPGCVDGDNY